MIAQTLQKDALKLAEFGVAVSVVMVELVIGSGMLWFYFA